MSATDGSRTAVYRHQALARIAGYHTNVASVLDAARPMVPPLNSHMAWAIDSPAVRVYR